VTTDQASCSLIIARGKIVVKRNSYASGLVAGDTAEAGKVREYNVPPLLRADDPVALAKWRSAVADANMHRVIVRTKVANPLGFVTFFELSRVGLTVKAVDGAVTVAAVAAGLPCAKAGLKAGDAIADVGGKKPADAESLRRLLRDALAVGPAAVAVRRGGAALTIQLSLPE
jgi:S1-C subfamily serine protease